MAAGAGPALSQVGGRRLSCLKASELTHPLHPGGPRDRPARGGLRLPQGLDAARGAPRLRGHLCDRLGADALFPRRHPGRDRLRARAQGQRRRRHLDELGQPLGGDGRGAGGRRLRRPGGRLPDRRRAAPGRRRARGLLQAARARGRGGDRRPRPRRRSSCCAPTPRAPTSGSPTRRWRSSSSRRSSGWRRSCCSPCAAPRARGSWPAGAVVAVVVAWGVAQWDYILPETLTFSQAAGDETTLWWVVAVFGEA